jgi:ferric-dicitrate binding protein FerR (iron transport regulator)
VRREQRVTLFEAAHPDQRRLRVQTDRAGVVAVGTQLDVYRKSSTTTVTVVEGIAGAACRCAVESQANKQAEWSMERRSIGMRGVRLVAAGR